MLYLILFLHQTTTKGSSLYEVQRCILFSSYIKPQPYVSSYVNSNGCILFSSYIKPQL